MRARRRATQFVVVGVWRRRRAGSMWQGGVRGEAASRGGRQAVWGGRVHSKGFRLLPACPHGLPRQRELVGLVSRLAGRQFGEAECTARASGCCLPAPTGFQVRGSQ